MLFILCICYICVCLFMFVCVCLCLWYCLDQLIVYVATTNTISCVQYIYFMFAMRRRVAFSLGLVSSPDLIRHVYSPSAILKAIRAGVSFESGTNPSFGLNPKPTLADCLCVVCGCVIQEVLHTR